MTDVHIGRLQNWQQRHRRQRIQRRHFSNSICFKCGVCERQCKIFNLSIDFRFRVGFLISFSTHWLLIIEVLILHRLRCKFNKIDKQNNYEWYGLWGLLRSHLGFGGPREAQGFMVCPFLELFDSLEVSYGFNFGFKDHIRVQLEILHM